MEWRTPSEELTGSTSPWLLPWVCVLVVVVVEGDISREGNCEPFKSQVSSANFFYLAGRALLMGSKRGSEGVYFPNSSQKGWSVASPI